MDSVSVPSCSASASSSLTPSASTRTRAAASRSSSSSGRSALGQSAPLPRQPQGKHRGKLRLARQARPPRPHIGLRRPHRAREVEPPPRAAPAAARAARGAQTGRRVGLQLCRVEADVAPRRGGVRGRRGGGRGGHIGDEDGGVPGGGQGVPRACGRAPFRRAGGDGLRAAPRHRHGLTLGVSG